MIFLPSAKFIYRPQTTVAPWTPLSLGNTVLYGWYKADAGLSVSTDGASVATWADQSGNGKHLSQATPANQGVFRTATNGVNGIPVLEFPSSLATPRFIQDTAFLGSDSDGFSFYVVSRNLPVRTQYGGAWMVGQSTAGGISQICDLQAPGSVALRFQNGSGDWATGDAYSTNYNVVKVSCGSSINSYKHKSTYSSAQNQPNSAPTNTIMGAGFRLGMNYHGSVGSQIAEVIVCNKELDTTEEASLDAYFRSRYGFGLYYGADLPVASPALWLDASRSDSLFVENTLVTPVTTDNGPVGGWKDLSGNNRHALQGTTGSRPTWRTPINGQNGLGVLSFNGSSQWLAGANPFSTASDFTLVAAVVDKSGSSGSSHITLGDNQWYGLATRNETSNRPGWLKSAVAWSLEASPITGLSTNQVLTRSGSSITYRRDGSQRLTGTTASEVVPTTGYFVGRAGPSVPYFANVSVLEYVLYTRALSPTEIASLESYIRAKWGTP